MSDLKVLTVNSDGITDVPIMGMATSVQRIYPDSK
jgi:hypothetical protein